MPHTAMNSSIVCGLDAAGVQYAPPQWPQFECELTAQVEVRAGKLVT